MLCAYMSVPIEQHFFGQRGGRWMQVHFASYDVYYVAEVLYSTPLEVGNACPWGELGAQQAASVALRKAAVPL